jgi:hypothetical protein
MIVQHKKGDFAGAQDFGFAGTRKSYWAEDGWHDTETMQSVPAPKEQVCLEDQELWEADPDCKHDIQCAPGGGVKCTKCRGWFCY